MLFTSDRSRDLKTDKYASGGGKYNVRYSTFPEDLFNSGAEKYGKSWVMINININTQSTQSFAAGAQTVDTEVTERRRNTNFDARGKQDGFNVVGAAATAGVAAAGASLIANIGSGQNAAQRGAAAASAAKITAATFAAVTGPAALLAGNINRETKRISTAIQLPMPNELNTSYGMMWGEDNTAIFDFLMRGAEIGRVATAAASGNMENLKGAGKVALDAATSKGLAVNSAFGAGGASAMTGLAANPKKEMIFEGVNFRTFSLRYKFFPKTEKELSAIDQITRLLKFHMHPEYKSEGRYTFVYPSEFDITFFTTDGYENEWVTKIGTCILTDLSVNYTPDGQWVNHTNGAPNAFEVTMTFKELGILTKEDIAEGY